MSLDWSALLLLRAYHGLNPSMGWLFAVALGLQHRDVRAVYRSGSAMGVDRQVWPELTNPLSNLEQP